MTEQFPLGTVISDLLADDEETLPPSDRTYLEFRQTVEPGMIDTGFDLQPAKSSAFTSRISGERFVDQSLRRHILAGAAFGARFNQALKQLAPGAALSQDDLRDALALYTVHDLHKTEEAQQRRDRAERDLSDEDKDVPEGRVEEFVEQLGLRKFDTGLEIPDYHASALGAETQSGRHRSVVSRHFLRLAEWVRLMDAAAGLDDPRAVSQIESRVGEITDEITLHRHRLDDSKGLATNLLNTTLADRITERDDLELVVFFEQGAVYLGRDDSPTGLSLFEHPDGQTDALPTDLADSFVDHVRDANPELTDVGTVRNLLDDSAYRFGYFKIPPLTYLFAGLERAFEGVKADLIARADRDPNEYTVYEDALKLAVGTGLVERPPQSYVKPQLLGVYLATIYHQLLTEELNDGDSIRSIRDLGEALALPDAVDLLVRTHKSTDSDRSDIELPEAGIDTLADAYDEAPEEIREDIRSGVTVGGGKKVESMVLALTFLDRELEDGGTYADRPLDAVLDAAEKAVFDYYRDWQPHWDEHRGSDWETDRPADEKRQAFERTLRGNLQRALPWYIKRYVAVDGRRFEWDISGKFRAYDRSTQARLCMLCSDELVGERRALKAFETNESVVGRSLTFTHFKTLDPSNSKEVTSVVCALCDLELNLRNAVTATDTNEDSRYLFLAPNHFHSPVDIHVSKYLHERIHDNGGRGFWSMARDLIGDDSTARYSTLEAILDELAEDSAAPDSLLNYDGSYADSGALGLFRLDTPSRPQESGGDPINRTSRWTVSVFTATVFAWLTGSRVIVSDSPFPSVGFDDVSEMVTVEGAPAQVARHLPTEVTISRLVDLADEPYQAYRFESATATDQAADDAVTTVEELAIATGSDSTLTLTTGFGVALYRLAALLYVTNRTHGIDLQRLSTMLSALSGPAPGASAVLREADEVLADDTAVFAATVLDTLTNPEMTSSITKLAEAGFDVVQPETRDGRPSNYEYERLFRAARDALSDKLVRNADSEELVDVVAGVVMEAGARTRTANARTDQDHKYADAQYTREPAERFAEIFVKEVFEDLCDGDFYELRRLENSLASGYNLAVRRRQREWFDEINDASDSDDDTTEQEVSQ